MAIELFDKKSKKLAAILKFDRNYSLNPIFSEQFFTISFSYEDLAEKYICGLFQILSRCIYSTAGLN